MNSTTETVSLHTRIRDLSAFVKFRLSLLVIFSAGLGFLIASGEQVDYVKLMWLLIGGFLVTGAANGFNEVIEKETDKLMERTANRPIPTERMSRLTGLLLASALGGAGIFSLMYFVNIWCGILGATAIVLYMAVYTPMKKRSPFAVFIGAFPGALPPLLGWVAASDGLAFGGALLFFIQFIWQFPHFWAIAWVIDEDYKKAGFKMLPSHGEKNRMSAFQAVAYAATLIPIGLLPYYFGMAGPVSAVIISIAGLLFTLQAVRLFRTLEDKHARQLMFGSFIYLPVVLLSLYLDKIVH